MSAFFLICGPKPENLGILGLRIVDLSAGGELERRAAADLFSEADRVRCWYATKEGASPDALFTDAQAAMAEGVPFADTQIYKLLVSVITYIDKIAIWYSDDWGNLPIVTDAGMFLEKLEQDLRNGPAECWLLFDNNSSQKPLTDL